MEEIKDWYSQLQEPLREMVLNNLSIAEYRTGAKYAQSMGEAIENGFSWPKTAERENFWWGVKWFFDGFESPTEREALSGYEIAKRCAPIKLTKDEIKDAEIDALKASISELEGLLELSQSQNQSDLVSTLEVFDKLGNEVKALRERNSKLVLVMEESLAHIKKGLPKNILIGSNDENYYFAYHTIKRAIEMEQDLSPTA